MTIAQYVLIGLVVVVAGVLRALGQESDELLAGVLTGALTYAGGHAIGFTQGKAENDSTTAPPSK